MDYLLLSSVNLTACTHVRTRAHTHTPTLLFNKSCLVARNGTKLYIHNLQWP